MELVLLLLFFGYLYFIPTNTAWHKGQRGSVFVLNLFLGWTMIGWVISLAIAAAPDWNRNLATPTKEEAHTINEILQS